MNSQCCLYHIGQFGSIAFFQFDVKDQNQLFNFYSKKQTTKMLTNKDNTQNHTTNLPPHQNQTQGDSTKRNSTSENKPSLSPHISQRSLYSECYLSAHRMQGNTLKGSTSFANSGYLETQSFGLKNVQQLLCITNQQQEDKVKQPLNYVATNICYSQLQACFKKVLLRNYLLMKSVKNTLAQGDLVLIQVYQERKISQFLKVKEQIEELYKKEQVEIIPVSKRLLFQSKQQLEVADTIVKQNLHTVKIDQKNMIFDELIIGASYAALFSEKRFKIQPNPNVLDVDLWPQKRQKDGCSLTIRIRQNNL